MNRFGTLALLAASGVLAGGASAATITWGAVSGVGGVTAGDIDTTGTAVDAVNSAGVAATVNGIAFTAGGAGGTAAAPFWTNAPASPGGNGADPVHGSSGNADLDNILDSHDTSFGSPSHPDHYTLELSGLTNGQEYQLQIIGIHDARGCCGNRTYVLGDGAGNFAGGPQLTRDSGGTVIGTFTADGANQTLLITNTAGPGGNDPGLGGYVLSEVPEPGSLALLGLGGLALLRRRRG